MNKLLIVAGPTATGKTELGIHLAKAFNGEIVSADSRHVYKGMDIGTGKDTPKNGVPIWLIDIVDPDYSFNLSDYIRHSRIAIRDVRKRNKLPIVVGGTGLYIKSLIKPLNFINIPRNENLRQKLADLSVLELRELLSKSDIKKYEGMNNSDINNSRRLIRAIEIAQSKNKNINKFLPSDFLMIYLRSDPQVLYKKIEKRVESRVKEGIVDEINSLVESGFSFDLPAFSAFPYRFFKSYINIKKTDEELNKIIKKWKTEEINYAKRQVTWFKKMLRELPESKIISVDTGDIFYYKKIEAAVEKWYT